MSFSMGQDQPGLLLSLSFSGTVWHLRSAVNSSAVRTSKPWSGFAEAEG